MTHTNLLKISALALALAATLAGCGGGDASISLRGAVSGLVGPTLTTLSLKTLSGTTQGNSGNGAFSFTGSLTGNEAFTLSATSPLGNDCQVSGGSGVTGSADVNGVAVTCVQTASIVGTLSGSTNGYPVTIEDSVSGLQATVNSGASGTSAVSSFALAGVLPAGQQYSLSITQQPLAGTTCSVLPSVAASGTIVASQLVTLTITCV